MAKKLAYADIAGPLAITFGVPPTVFLALLMAESNWDPRAISSTGATGLGQFTRGTASDYGLMGDGFDNRADAALNMLAAVMYMRDLKKKWLTWRLALGHYSGQLNDKGEADFSTGYSKYAAGQALIMAVDVADGVKPTAGDASFTGQVTVQTSGGKPVSLTGTFTAIALVFALLISTSCQKLEERQQIAKLTDVSSFVLVPKEPGIGSLRR